MSLLRSSMSIGGLTLLSRMLGFVRDQLFANLVGAGMAADCFVAAFRLPNLFRALFAEGAFSAAFVPMFSRTIKGDNNNDGSADKNAGKALAEEALAFLLPFLLGFTALMLVLTPVIVWLMSGLRTGEPQRFALAVEFTRLTFPYLMFISLVALLGGALNGLGRFSAAAAAPILLNVTLITGLLFFHGSNDISAARTQSAAVAVAGMVQFIWLAFAAHRHGLSLKLRWPKWTPRVAQLLRTAGPAAIGAGASQINLFISTSLSFGVLGEGAASYLYFADRLNQLPLGLIGIGVGTALLPSLSRLLANDELDAAKATQNRAMELALFFALPATIALMLIAAPLIKGLLQHGAFTAADTQATARTLVAFSLGLPAYILIKILVPGFHARSDTSTPVRIGFISIAVNLIGNVACVFFTELSYVGIALATAFSAWVNVALLYWHLRKRGYFRADSRFKQTALRLILPNILMGAAIYFVAKWVDPWLSAHLAQRVAALAALVATALLVYFATCILLRALPLADIKRAIKRR
jgi:putative peptidoglycan lipid II flippase